MKALKCKLTSTHLLKMLGYEIDGKGNIHQTLTQLAVLSLENTPDGGVLRIHGEADNVFFSGEQQAAEMQSFCFPSKITKNYVYFEGSDGKIRVDNKEFIESATIAIGQMNQLVQKKVAA